MAIVASDIVYRHSGAGANSNPNADLGGAISSVAMTDNADNNMFDDLSSAETTAGDVEYRCFYVRNAHATLTMQNSVVYVSQDTSSYLDIGLATQGLNGTASTIANESTAPSPTVTFSHPTTAGAGLSLGNMAPGDVYAIWVRRTVPSSTPALTAYTFKLAVKCDTAA